MRQWEWAPWPVEWAPWPVEWETWPVEWASWPVEWASRPVEWALWPPELSSMDCGSGHMAIGSGDHDLQWWQSFYYMLFLCWEDLSLMRHAHTHTRKRQVDKMTHPPCATAPHAGTVGPWKQRGWGLCLAQQRGVLTDHSWCSDCLSLSNA